MTPRSHGGVAGFLALVAVLAPIPLAFLMTEPVSAEPRKFMVLLAEPFKAYGPAGRPRPLPNSAEVWDYYFDQVKDGVGGGPRIDSHAEWWDEISYGEVTVSGNVYGWTAVPWPTVPPGGSTTAAPTPGTTAPFIDLNGNNVLDADRGENFFTFVAKYRMDFDGTGGTEAGDQYGNFAPFEVPGARARDTAGNPLFTPGERFQDLNGNRAYDAGFYEYGIDKNRNGRIDFEAPLFRASSFAELIAAETIPPPAGAPQGTLPTFVRWRNQTEWFDSNRDNEWDSTRFDDLGPIADPLQAYTLFFGPGLSYGVWLGDPYGTEIWIDRNGDNRLGQRMQRQTGGQDTPPPLEEFIFRINSAEQQETEWFDQQWNNNFDFPEPYEDFLRRWGIPVGPGGEGRAHSFIPVTEEYIRANYPGDPESLERLVNRTGNGRCDLPDSWSNRGTQTNTNKIQLVEEELFANDERTEQQRMATFQSYSRQPGARADGAPAWWEPTWLERYGTTAPEWQPDLTYVRKFNPSTPDTVIPRVTTDIQRQMPFGPNRGGPINDGSAFVGSSFVGVVLPNINDERDGMYDGPKEYDDLPESIYHRAGDGSLGSITSPWNNDIFGQDRGPGRPGPGVDGIIEPGGPGAVNVHGNSGWDAGNLLTPELLTWRTDGSSIADGQIDCDADGQPDRAFYRRDCNLDGLIDLGETPGTRGSYGLDGIRAGFTHNYSADTNPGTLPLGGPDSEYPFNRLRLMEDTVHALDEVIDFDEFLGGPPPFGDRISGVLLVPQDTAPGEIFRLPATGSWPSPGGLDLAQALQDQFGPQPIRTRDLIDPRYLPNGRCRNLPILMFNGLATSIDNQFAGEGSAFGSAGQYEISFAGHEYGHMWEGYPDLYDYDVRRFGAIVNNPVGRFCVMANGGLVHPVPALKEDSGWIDVADITRELTPGERKTIRFESWEYNPFRTVRKFTNPLRPGEQYYFWRASPGFFNGTETLVDQFGRRIPDPLNTNFNFRMPAWGLCIMQVDRGEDPEALPPQQSIEGRFIYRVIQADGLQQLEAGENIGDPSDSFPGTQNITRWDAVSDPNSRWYNNQTSGLDIVDVRDLPLQNATEVDFIWVPRELPIFNWIQPPGGLSFNRRYNVRYFAYDQFGGTRINIFAVRNVPGATPIQVGSATKPPGDLDATTSVDISPLTEVGEYVFFVQLVPGPGADGSERSSSVPRAGLDNLGTGELTIQDVNVDVSLLETWTIEFAGNGNWNVRGSRSGLQTRQAQTGQLYRSDPDPFGRAKIAFQIDQFAPPGGGQVVPFAIGDRFSFLTTGRTENSAPVYVCGREVVVPRAPNAVAEAAGSLSGPAPHRVVFRQNRSTDPSRGTLRFRWDFGDETPAVETTSIDAQIDHTYFAPGIYTATLTVTNECNISSSTTLQVIAGGTPTARITVSPLTGVAPLLVVFDATQSQRDASGSPLRFSFDFGDGTPLVTTLDGRITHTYSAVPGRYTARVTVSNEFGLSDVTQSFTIFADVSPPTARLTATPLEGVAPLLVRFDSTQSIDQSAPEVRLLTEIDFGDGTPRSTNPVIDHEYTNPGNYTATLRVTNPRNNKTGTTTLRVTALSQANQPPVAVIGANRLFGRAPLAVNFTSWLDLNSNGIREASERASSDPEGAPLQFEWNFGDGSSIVRGVPATSRTFSRPGTYNVTLTVFDDLGQSNSATVAIVATSNVTGPNSAPLARISTNRQSGPAPLTVRFDGGGSSDPEGGNLAYLWSFGDLADTRANGASVEFTYSQPGLYRVRLAVTDESGLTGESQVEINVTTATGQTVTDPQAGADIPGADGGSGGNPNPVAGICGPFGFAQLLLTMLGLVGIRRWSGAPR